MNPDSLTLATIANQVALALAEDIGAGDLTASLIPADRKMSGTVIARETGILAGRAWFDEVFAQLDTAVVIEWQVADGEAVTADQVLCNLTGSARSLLTGERTALNFIQLLSAVATRTHRFTEAVKATRCQILDTRKTIPGLRLAQKYAVRCGGGSNHRMGLYDAVLIKENHISSAGSIAAAVARAQDQTTRQPVLVEVEVESIDELNQAIAAQADRVLLDNFSLSELRSAADLAHGKIELEASGGITLETVVEIAETGVDFISVGELTKTIDALDLSMRLI